MLAKPYEPTKFECGWCFNMLKNIKIPGFGFVFCSSKCCFKWKEFENIFRK
jgi:hypothetical protein